MAHYTKFNRAACGHMWKHYERAKDENGVYLKFGNQDIDLSKTHLNYNLGPMHMNGQGGFVRERCSEVKIQKRADVNVMCSWVVTAPKELRSEETEKFFSETYNFLSDRYGKENVISSYVHMDEISPHMHFAFVPVVEDKKKNILKVSAKEAVTKKDLEIFHQHFSKYMENNFGRDIGVLNEATKDGNQSIKELKSGTAKKELEEIREQTEEIKLESEKQGEIVQKASEAIKILENKKRGLEDEIGALETKYKGKQMTAAKLEGMKPEKDIFGNIRNITLEDIEKLKGMAMTTGKYRMAWKKSSEEIARLRQENEELKRKVPTLKERMGRAERESKLAEENKEIKRVYERLQKSIGRMPEEQWQEFKKIIGTVIEEERIDRESKQIDMGYELGD